MNRTYHGMIWSLLLCSISTYSTANTPIFLVTPNITGPSQLVQGQPGTAVYQVTNNSNRSLTNIGLANLPTGVSQIASAGLDYCAPTFNMAAGTSCLIKLQINSNITNNVQSGPKVCFSATKPVYCSQPLQIDQLSTQVTPGPISQSCQDNVANFNYELTQQFDSTTSINPMWGPARNTLQLSPSNPNLTNCATTAGISWQQQRILAAADFWINQKLNYCEHYVPDYQTPVANRGAVYGQGAYCNASNDIYPGTVYYNQQVRWNYNGTGSKTASNWVNNGAMWYGLDCSNYTAFLYNFAFGIDFSSGITTQAGQAENGSQSTLTPNQQSPGNYLDNPQAAGKLVCQDNTTEVNHSCSGHGGYISVFNSSGTRIPSLVTSAMLAALQPGDLLYIAASLTDGSPSTGITHVVMWTGKTIGTASGNINPSLIAPNELCPNDWKPQNGGWVITDSHYQGADYRMITPCFYLNNLWGVRRVIL